VSSPIIDLGRVFGVGPVSSRTSTPNITCYHKYIYHYPYNGFTRILISDPVDNVYAAYLQKYGCDVMIRSGLPRNSF